MMRVKENASMGTIKSTGKTAGSPEKPHNKKKNREKLEMEKESGF